MKMTVDPEIIKIIERTVKEEVSRSLGTIQLSQLKEQFLTREDFLNAMDRMDKRFEALQLQLDNNFQELRSSIDNIGDRAGKGLQRAVIKLLKAQNKIRDIDFSKIQRLPIIDTDGVVFPKGFTSDIDVLMENGKTILLEIKFKIDSGEISHFYDLATLYEKLYKKPDELWVLSLEISPRTLANAARYPMKIIYGKKKR